MSSTIAPAEPAAHVAEIRRALDLLAVPGGVVEIRGLDVPARYGKPCTVAGYFDDLDQAAQAASATRQAEGRGRLSGPERNQSGPLGTVPESNGRLP